MSGPRSTRRKVKAATELAEPGVVVWQSHEEVSRARRRTAWLAAGLGALALLWLTGLSDGTGDNVVLGVVILEIFTLVPLVMTLLRLRQLNALLRRMRTHDADEQREQIEDLQLVDDALFRISRLAGQLDGEVAQSAGLESVAAAERACHEWRRLVAREHDLEDILETTEGVAARASLERSLTLCRQDAASFRGEVEELAAALAELVDASDDAPVEAALVRLRAARERMDALASSFREVNAIADQSLGRASPG